MKLKINQINFRNQRKSIRTEQLNVKYTVK
jgi:hypothetical protein